MSSTSQFSLLTQRRFGPFFWTQFLGAFNDNVFKIALLTVLTYEAMSWTTMDVGLLNNLIPGLFILPFVLFSATAGQWADKFEKSHLTRRIKLLEILLMSVAAIGWATHNLWLLVAVIAGMGLQSTLFGPVKYAYLPQHLKPSELVGGNGMVEMGTFVGILTGEIIGAMLVLQKPWGVHIVAVGTIAIAVLGWLASRRIPVTPAAEPMLKINPNPLSETFRNLRFSWQNRPVRMGMLANSWFWFYGAILLAQFPVYTRDFLQGDHGVFVLLLAAFSLGIGAGSLACDRLSGHKAELGLVPFGALGMSLFGFDLYIASTAYIGAGAVDALGFMAQQGSWRILFDCTMIGVAGGIYVVPLFVLVQTRCDPRHLSRTIAGMNVLNALFMVVAALIGMLLLQAGASIPDIFLVTAILNAVALGGLCIAMPEFALRFMAWLLARTFCRLRVIGADRMTPLGGTVLLCQPTGPMAALAVLSVSARPMRLVMDGSPSSRCRSRFCAWLHRQAKTIWRGGAGDEDLANTREAIARALAAREVVCIFTGEAQASGGLPPHEIRATVETLVLPTTGLLDPERRQPSLGPFADDGIQTDQSRDQCWWKRLTLRVDVLHQLDADSVARTGEIKVARA